MAQLGMLYLSDNKAELAIPLLDQVLSKGDAATAGRIRAGLHLPAPAVRETPGASGANQPDPRVLGEKSYQAGYLQDALRYFSQAREANPQDGWLALRLGWTNNLLHDDATALRWFNIARQSDDPAIAAEANRAWRNLSEEQERFRTTVWLYPLYSSR
jgi:tetratricopeptide (TPR) repeat protein